LVRHPDGAGAGQHVAGIVQPPDILPSVLEFMKIPVPDGVEGRTFWPLVAGDESAGREYAFSNRFPSVSGQVGGAAFDGWVGSDRIIEPATITDETWSFICAPQGLPSELYNLQEDPEQLDNVIEDHPDVAARMRDAWLDVLRAHGASEDRIRPFEAGGAEAHATTGETIYAFRDDIGQWIAFPTEREARAAAYRENAPGGPREITPMTFGELLADNPKNLIHLFDQYYWAEDLA
jgi:hypothetical protein